MLASLVSCGTSPSLQQRQRSSCISAMMAPLQHFRTSARMPSFQVHFQWQASPEPRWVPQWFVLYQASPTQASTQWCSVLLSATTFSLLQPSLHLLCPILDNFACDGLQRGGFLLCGSKSLLGTIIHSLLKCCRCWLLSASENRTDVSSRWNISWNSAGICCDLLGGPTDCVHWDKLCMLP